jgi:flagella synthesis protein FlgN
MINAARMDADALVTELESIVRQEISAAARVRDILEAEHGVLGQRDPDRLSTVTADKTAALETLEALERRRREVCARVGAGPAPADLSAWLAAHGRPGPAAASLEARWVELTRVVSDCRRLNQANGLVVATLQRRSQQVLNLLRTGDSEPAAYGRTGRTLSGPGARAIARA